MNTKTIKKQKIEQWKLHTTHCQGECRSLSGGVPKNLRLHWMEYEYKYHYSVSRIQIIFELFAHLWLQTIVSPPASVFLQLIGKLSDPRGRPDLHLLKLISLGSLEIQSCFNRSQSRSAIIQSSESSKLTSYPDFHCWTLILELHFTFGCLVKLI